MLYLIQYHLQHAVLYIKQHTVPACTVAGAGITLRGSSFCKLGGGRAWRCVHDRIVAGLKRHAVRSRRPSPSCILLVILPPSYPTTHRIYHIGRGAILLLLRTKERGCVRRGRQFDTSRIISPNHTGSKHLIAMYSRAPQQEGPLSTRTRHSIPLPLDPHPSSRTW